MIFHSCLCSPRQCFCHLPPSVETIEGNSKCQIVTQRNFHEIGTKRSYTRCVHNVQDNALLNGDEMCCSRHSGVLYTFISFRKGYLNSQFHQTCFCTHTFMFLASGSCGPWQSPHLQAFSTFSGPKLFRPQPLRTINRGS